MDRSRPVRTILLVEFIFSPFSGVVFNVSGDSLVGFIVSDDAVMKRSLPFKIQKSGQMNVFRCSGLISPHQLGQGFDFNRWVVVNFISVYFDDAVYMVWHYHK